MYAIVRENSFDSERLRQSQGQLAKFEALHSSQPGYAGTVVVDVGNGRRLTVNLWESQEHAMAALPTLVPELQRLLEPLMTEPSRLIGNGSVVLIDLTKTRVTERTPSGGTR